VALPISILDWLAQGRWAMNFSPGKSLLNKGCIFLKCRSDLVWSAAVDRDQVGWVAKDPIEVKYFRLRDDERFVLDLLDGHRSISEIRDHYNKQYSPRRVNNSQIQQLVNHFYREGLAISSSPNQSRALMDRRRKQAFQSWPNWITAWLFLKLPGVHADRLVNSLHGWIRPVLRGESLILVALATFFSAFWLVICLEKFLMDIQQFQRWTTTAGLLAAGLCIALAKTAHELGHAVLTKHLGGECHEIGVMLMFGVPCLYCDTSDLWLIDRRWGRLLVAGGGMIVELSIASLATLLWTLTHPGLLHWLSLDLILVCLIGTVLINANPLLRYDGYYMLVDFLGIQNLSQEASQRTARIFSWMMSGLWRPIWPERTPMAQTGLIAYSVLSWTYRSFIVLGIAWIILSGSRRLGVEELGWKAVWAGGLSLLIALVLPRVARTAHGLRQPQQNRQWRPATARFFLFVTLSLVLGYWVLLTPRPHRLLLTGQLHPAELLPVVAAVPGAIAGGIEYGLLVTASETLVQLSSSDLDLELLELSRQQEQQQILVDCLRRGAVSDESLANQIPAAQMLLQSLKKQTDSLRSQAAQLRIRSVRSARWLAPLEQPSGQNSETLQLSRWSGAPLTEENREGRVQSGAVLGLLGEAERVQVTSIVEQRHVDWLKPGQRASVCVAAQPEMMLTASVRRISIEPVREISRRFADLPGVRPKAGDPLLLEILTPCYLVTLDVELPLAATGDPALKEILKIDGMNARVSVILDERTWTERIWRWLSGQLRF
jgi:putative peptide zinc metalloprotease protein